MKYKIFGGIILAALVSVPADASNLSIGAISESVKMEGVAGFVEGRVRDVLKATLSQKGTDWMCDAFANAVNNHRRGGSVSGGVSKLFYQDAAVRAAVESELKMRIREWLPNEIKKFIKEDLFAMMGAPEELKELNEITNKIIENADKTLNGQIDDMASGLYSNAISNLQEMAGRSAATSWLDVTDVRGSVRRAMSFKNVTDLAVNNLGRIVGDSTVSGIRMKISEALNGTLPAEVVGALEKGPKEFDEYVSKIGNYLPGARLGSLTSSVLNRPVFKLPTPAYAAMLMASAAGHFARAFEGPFVNPYELKRGTEVIRVLVWQVSNKQNINLSIMQLGGLARGVAARFGMGGAFEGMISKLKEPLDKLQGMADKIDELVMKPIKDVEGELKKISGDIQGELSRLESQILSPVRDEINKIEDTFEKVGTTIIENLPKNFNGMPVSWDELKDKAGIHGGVLGDSGNVSLSDALEKLKKVGDEISDKFAKGAAGALEGLHLLGPAARIMDVEIIPAKNPSVSNELDPVFLHTGEFVQEITDIEIPGRGLNFRFTRIFRGHGNFTGELGWNWTHSYAERLLSSSEGGALGLTYIDDRGRKYFFKKTDEGYLAPKDLGVRLSEISEGYLLANDLGERKIFDKEGRLVRVSDKSDNLIDLTYGAKGLLSSVSDVFGRVIKIERRSDGLISKLTDFAGRSIRYDYNDEQELIGTTSPVTPDFPKGKTTAYRYDPAGEGHDHALSMIMDPKGNVYLRNRYDGDGRVIFQRYGNDPWVSVQYGGTKDGVSKYAWVTDTKGVTRLYEHDEEGHLVNLSKVARDKYEAIAPKPSLPSWEGDGGRGAYEYYPSSDPDGDGIAIANPKGSAKEGGYLKSVTQTGAGGKKETAQFEYDIIGNITAVKYPDGREVRFAVNSLNQILSEKWSNGLSIFYSFDANDNLVQAVSNHGGRKLKYEFQYDVLDRMILKRVEVAENKFADTKYTYDAYGLVTAIEYPEHSRDAFEYDNDGNLLCVTYGANSLEARRECGAHVQYMERPAAYAFEEEDPNTKIRYQWNGNNRLIAVIDPKGNRTQFGYDDLGRQILEKYADGTANVIAYNSEGLIAGVIDRNGSVIKIEYDANGNIKERRAIPAEGVIGTTAQRFEHDEDGRLVLAVDYNDIADPDDDAVSYFIYDAESRIVAESFRDKWLTRAFDGQGRIASQTYPSGETYFFSYDVSGQPAWIVNTKNRVAAFEYDPSGLLNRLIYGDYILEIEFKRDNRGQIYSYNGRDVLWRDGKISSESGYAGTISTYERNASGELTRVSEDSGWQWRFEYDPAGNFVSKEDPDYFWTFETNTVNAYTKITRIKKEDGFAESFEPKYDSNGNLVSDGKREFRYDVFNRLVAVWSGGVLIERYSYDVFGRRILARADEERREFIWDAERMVEEVRNDATYSDFVFHEALAYPIFASINGETRYILGDLSGSVVGTLDEHRHFISRCKYDPFGAPVDPSCGDIDIPFRYGGYQYDIKTNFSYMVNRYYDPALGRFISPDPLGSKVDGAGKSGTILGPLISYHMGQGGASHATFSDRFLSARPQYDAFPFNRIFGAGMPGQNYAETNLYSYARNDPTTFSDPLGLASLLFDKSDNKIYLRDSRGRVIDKFRATNRTVHPGADPLVVGGGGPFPNGIYSLGIPEFYSEEYRRYVMQMYELGPFRDRDGFVNGHNWKQPVPDANNYNAAFGRVRIRAGAPAGTNGDAIVYARALFLHGGRRDYRRPTEGCIRINDRDLERLAVEFINMKRELDPIENITVQN